MNCPFCGSKMLEGYKNTKPLTEIFMCISDGPLIDRKDHPHCPYRKERLTRADIDKIIVALIDVEME